MSRQRTTNRQAGPLGGDGEDRRELRSTPLPSSLDGRRYVIRDSRGGRAFVGRDATTGVMQVPLSPTDADRRLRLHEMAHVRWTPANPIVPGASHDTVNAVEDGRVHKRLREVGLDLAASAPLYGPEEWAGLERQFADDADGTNVPRKWTPLGVAQFRIATIGTAEERCFGSIARIWGHDWVLPIVDEMFVRHFGKRRPAWKRTCEFAAELEATFAELDELSDDVRDTLNEYRGEGPRQVDAADLWGDMTIREMPLVVRLPRGLRTKVRRSSDTGAVPRYWHRVPIDQRVFAVRRHKPQGGTVLIDQSGSMSLDMDDVQAIIAAYPAVTIATYAGRDGSGELRVIARNGQRASDTDCLHPWSQNVIDGPALEWLSSMPEPRVWVSDGKVTGRGERMSTQVVLDAARIAKKGRVRRVESLDALTPAE